MATPRNDQPSKSLNAPFQFSTAFLEICCDETSSQTWCLLSFGPSGPFSVIFLHRLSEFKAMVLNPLH